MSRVTNGNPQVDPQIGGGLCRGQETGRRPHAEPEEPDHRFCARKSGHVNEFQSKVLLGAEGYCAQNDWDLQFISFRRDLNAPPDEFAVAPCADQAEPAGGVILSGTHSVSILAALRESGFLSRWWETILWVTGGRRNAIAYTPMTCVGRRRVTRHLIAQGHSAIWYIGNLRLPWFARCAKGYEEAMKEAGLEPRFK